MSRASSIKAFRKAVELLRSIDSDLSLYVGASTMHLMKGPSHDDASGRPLKDNIVDSSTGLYISGGDW